MDQPKLRSYSQQPQQVAPANSWLERNQRYKPQSNSVGSALFIFVSGGMSIAWSTGFSGWSAMPSNLYMPICWFVAAIFGALLGAAANNRLPKKNILFASSLSILLGGILFAACPTTIWIIMLARHLNGFGVGLIFVPTLVLGGEQVIKHRRGMVTAGIEAMSFSLGAFVQISFAAAQHPEKTGIFSSNLMHGISCIVCGLVSLAFAYFLLVESPLYQLLCGQEEQAIETLRCLQDPAVITQETYEQFEQLKLYLADSKAKTMKQSFVDSLPALVKLSYLRALLAMSFSLIINLTMMSTNFYIFTHYVSWPNIIFGASRWLGSIIAIFMLDTLGRKKPLAFGILIAGAMLIGVGVIYHDTYNVYRNVLMSTALILLCLHQFFAGVAVTTSSAYLSEAFPLAAKPYCMAVAFVVELLVHIVIIAVTLSFESIATYFFIVAAFSLFFAGYTILCMPETKNLSLLDAQRMFNGFFSSGY